MCDQDDHELIGKYGPKVVYRGVVSDVTVAIRPEVEAAVRRLGYSPIRLNWRGSGAAAAT
jgi:hypothetical protein